MDARLWSGGVSVLQAANVAAFAIAIALNASLGSSNKAISDAHRTAFTPAGYAFSIWGVIYTLMAGFVVWQCHPSRAGWVGQLVGLWFIANCLANALWIVAFTQEWGNLWVSTVVIVGLLATISVLYTSFRLTEKMTFIQYLVTNVYISVYLGWVSVATIANVAVAGTPKNGVADWGWSASSWSIAMQCVAVVLALTVMVATRDAVFSIPVVWALFAIAVQQAEDTYPGDERVVAAAKALASILLTVAVAVICWQVYAWYTGVTPPFLPFSGSEPGAVTGKSGLVDGDGLAQSAHTEL